MEEEKVASEASSESEFEVVESSELGIGRLLFFDFFFFVAFRLFLDSGFGVEVSFSPGSCDGPGCILFSSIDWLKFGLFNTLVTFFPSSLPVFGKLILDI